MPNSEKYRWVVGRVPDTGDALGTGGTRRADGTMARQVRDLRYLDDDAVSRLATPTSRGTSPGRTLGRELGAQAVVVAVDILMREVVFPGTAKLWREQVAPVINHKKEERRSKKAARVEPEPGNLVEIELIEVEVSEPGVDIDTADTPVVELSKEKAEWHIAEAQRAAHDLAEHLSVLRHARVVDDADILALLAGQGQLEASEALAIENGAGVGEDPEPEPVRVKHEPELRPSPTCTTTTASCESQEG